MCKFLITLTELFILLKNLHNIANIMFLKLFNNLLCITGNVRYRLLKMKALATQPVFFLKPKGWGALENQVAFLKKPSHNLFGKMWFVHWVFKAFATVVDRDASK